MYVFQDIPIGIDHLTNHWLNVATSSTIENAWVISQVFVKCLQKDDIFSSFNPKLDIFSSSSFKHVDFQACTILFVILVESW